LQRKRPSASSLSIHFETLCVFQQLGILLIEYATRCPEAIEWPCLDDFVLGNLFTGHILIRHVGGILFTAPQRIPKVVCFLARIISVGGGLGKIQHAGDSSRRKLADTVPLIWCANIICTLLESQTGDSELESHLRFIARLSEETQHFISAHNLPFCKANASSLAYWHKLWIRFPSDSEGRKWVCWQTHNASIKLGKQSLSNSNPLYLAFKEFLSSEGHVTTPRGNLVSKALRHVARQNQARLPSSILSRRRSIDFSELPSCAAASRTTTDE